jgi:hypothetical protein
MQRREYEEVGAGHAPQPFGIVCAEFRSIIDNLEPDQQQQAVALFRPGRGEFDAGERDDALAAGRLSSGVCATVGFAGGRTGDAGAVE